MKYFSKQFKQILLTVALLLFIAPAFAQKVKTKRKGAVNNVQIRHQQSQQLKDFIAISNAASVFFKLPDGFKEVKAPDNDDYSFDYAMTIPDQQFVIWCQVRSQKENYSSYLKSQEANGKLLANPDSIYIDIGKAHALALSGDKNYFVRNVPDRVLSEYNADAGKTILLNLLDDEATGHYKYALIITLQKDHIGTILVVCLTDDKGPDFFKNINKARNCIRFK